MAFFLSILYFPHKNPTIIARSLFNFVLPVCVVWWGWGGVGKFRNRLHFGFMIFHCEVSLKFLYLTVELDYHTNYSLGVTTQLAYFIFTNSAPLGGVGHRVAMSVCLRHRETPTSGGRVDLWSKIAFLILVWDDTIFKKRGV